jgi:hypothetical protein
MGRVPPKNSQMGTTASQLLLFWSASLVVWLWFLFLLCKKWLCQLLLLR